MMPHQANRLFKWLYLAAMAVVFFTGLGNMPLYQRYYVTDVPGFDWAGDFMINVQVHYMAGAVLLSLAAYFTVSWIYLRKEGRRLSRTGRIRAIVLGLTLLTGLAMAVKNLSGVVYPLPLLITMNFLHMSLAVCFLLLALGCRIARAPWLRKD
jgi:hypothetical protein